MIDGPAIWSATPLESAWHQSIADIWQHVADCLPCAIAEVAERPTQCSVGLKVRAAETTAWQATKTDMYVPLAVQP